MTWQRIIGGGGAFIFAVLAGGMLSGCPNGMPIMTYTITVENLTSGQPFAPIVGVAHSNSIHLFRIGELASDAIETMAEQGNPMPLVDTLEGNPLVTSYHNVGMPTVAMGTNNGGFSDTNNFTLTASPFDVFSMAGMLAITNDGIVGIDSTAFPLSGTKVIYALGYDVGTEDNTEASEDLGDPASVLGPVALEGDPNGNENDAVNTDPPQPIMLHPGILGGGDLTPEIHGWPEPVARVTITAGTVQ
ncbi:MAG: spondin domain-containing protein [Candidatus Hydrogenedentes bacterium]|nr:spondin domain-containing protein [Candidatus Hydrogenedentota bacterium]